MAVLIQRHGIHTNNVDADIDGAVGGEFLASEQGESIANVQFADGLFKAYVTDAIDDEHEAWFPAVEGAVSNDGEWIVRHGQWRRNTEKKYVSIVLTPAEMEALDDGQGWYEPGDRCWLGGYLDVDPSDGSADGVLSLSVNGDESEKNGSWEFAGFSSSIKERLLASIDDSNSGEDR